MYSRRNDPKGPGFPIRRSTDQSLLAASRGLSQRATSFIASWCQGIHQMPLRRLIHITRHAQGQAPQRNGQTCSSRPDKSLAMSRRRRTRTFCVPGDGVHLRPSSNKPIHNDKQRKSAPDTSFDSDIKKSVRRPSNTATATQSGGRHEFVLPDERLENQNSGAHERRSSRCPNWCQAWCQAWWR